MREILVSREGMRAALVARVLVNNGLLLIYKIYLLLFNAALGF